MGTNDGTVPWCVANSGGYKKATGPVTTIDKPTIYDWCPKCITVFKNLYPAKQLPPTLKRCKTNTLECNKIITKAACEK